MYEGHRTNLAFSCLDVADDGGQFRLHENDQSSAHQLNNNAVSILYYATELRIIKYLLAAQKDVVALFIRTSFECFEYFVLPYTSVGSGSAHEPTGKMNNCAFPQGSVCTICCVVKGDDLLKANNHYITCDSIPSCFILGIHPNCANKPNLSRCC